MTSDVPRRAEPMAESGPVPVEQAEAVLVEHYPRLVRLAYLILPATLGRQRRVLTAHAVVQRALPRGRAAQAPDLPVQRAPGGPAPESGYTYVRLRVVCGALAAQRPWRLGPVRLGRGPRPRPLLPRAMGLRLLPRGTGEDDAALEGALSGCSEEGRAAFALRTAEGLNDDDVFDLLEAAGVDDPDDALDEADEVRLPAGSQDRSPLASVEFDPCVLKARPTDLMRRRQHGRAALVAVAALAVCGVLLGLPGDGWGPQGAAAPAYAQNPAAQRAMDPERLASVKDGAWKTSSRADFSVWPARGELVGDKALLRRALAVWARPGGQVNVTATPGTAPGPAAGPPQLLYAGEVDGASLVVFHDGLRVVRYAEPAGGKKGVVGLDFARTDAADTAGASMVLLTRSDGNARYLTGPWVEKLVTVDLLRPADDGTEVGIGDDGITDPVQGPPLGRDTCETWPALRVTARGEGQPYLLSDLGELTPARLTFGAPDEAPQDAVSTRARAVLARSACQFPLLAAQGVRAVNSWEFGRHQLPEGGGGAAWLCTRAETWRGAGGQALSHFLPPAADGRPAAAAVVGRATDTAACGPRDPKVLAGALWKSPTDKWYLIGVGSRGVASITASGGVTASADRRLLVAPAEQGAKAELSARTADGEEFGPLK
nr:hypothetical protein [Streptomyces alkaliterrae]